MFVARCLAEAFVLESPSTEKRLGWGTTLRHCRNSRSSRLEVRYALCTSHCPVLRCQIVQSLVCTIQCVNYPYMTLYICSSLNARAARRSHYHAFSRSFFGAPRSTHLSLALSNATAVPRRVPLHRLLVWRPLPGPAWSADAIARENNSC